MIPDLRLAKAAACFVVMAILTAILIFTLFATGQVETIDATAHGTSTQMAALASVRVIISQFPTTEDRG
jgi:hypothetical protein